MAVSREGMLGGSKLWHLVGFISRSARLAYFPVGQGTGDVQDGTGVAPRHTTTASSSPEDPSPPWGFLVRESLAPLGVRPSGVRHPPGGFAAREPLAPRGFVVWEYFVPLGFVVRESLSPGGLQDHDSRSRLEGVESEFQAEDLLVVAPLRRDRVAPSQGQKPV